jgi:hypothetical protein
MLTWLASASLLAAIVVATRWWLRRVDALGRARPFPVFSMALLVVVGVGLFVPGVRQHQLEDRLAVVASDLAGYPVLVNCQTAGQEWVDVGSELGYVRYGRDGVPERATLIKRAQCTDLSRYLRRHGDHPDDGQVLAVHVLTHEAMHMAGITDEARAECLAVQRDAKTARLLGASPREAADLARRYWRAFYPRMPDGYVSPECKPGGQLDQALPDAPWLLTD